jgi:hypothetical protein
MSPPVEIHCCYSTSHTTHKFIVYSQYFDKLLHNYLKCKDQVNTRVQINVLFFPISDSITKELPQTI